MTSPARVGRLTVITDTHIQSRYTHEEIAELACTGGADVIQLRDKRMGRDEFAAVAIRMRDICHGHGVVFIINDRAELAGQVGADGVHVGPDDLSVASARAMLGPRSIIGASTGSITEIGIAQAAGADYIGFGHIFATSSKSKASAPVGLEALAAACQSATIPVIAIGGIDDGNAADVMRAGAWGVAVIAAVCAAEDPRRATRALCAIVTAAASRTR